MHAKGKTTAENIVELKFQLSYFVSEMLFLFVQSSATAQTGLE